MKVKELIEELKKYDSDTEVKLLFYMYRPDGHLEPPQITNFQVKKYRLLDEVHLRAIMPKFEDSVCMVGGHHENCQCHLGYVAEWRKRNE